VKATPGSAVAPRPLRWVLACLILAFAAAFSGCSDGDDERRIPASAVGGALAHIRSDSSVVFAVETDLEKGAVSGVDRLGPDARRAIAAVVRSQIGQRGVPFDSVVRPQLGNPLVIGITRGGDPVAAMRVSRAAKLRRDVERILDRGGAERADTYQGTLVWKERRPDGRGRHAALDGTELVVAASERDLHEAIDAARGSGNLASSRWVVAALGETSLVRGVGYAQRLLDSRGQGQAADARKVPWIRALGGFAFNVEVIRPRDVESAGGELFVSFELATKRIRLSERDLPLVPGGRSITSPVTTPRLHDPAAPASIAVLEPRRLVRFLERSLQATDPARFERYQTGVEQLRAILRVDLRRDLIDRIKSLSLAARSATAFTFVGTLERGAAPGFRRDLDRARLFVEGFLNDVVPGTSVRARGTGAQRVWVVENRGLTLARYAVRGGALVGSVGSSRLPDPAGGRRPRYAVGSLVLKGDLGRIGRLLGFLFDIPDQAFGVVSRLGDLTLGVKIDTRGVLADGPLRVRPVR
jgi:hypothetical protein